MKTILTLIATITFLFSIQAQETYYVNSSGKYYSVTDYNEMKEKQLKKIQEVVKRMKLYESIDTLKVNKDSIVLHYQLTFTDNIKKSMKQDALIESYIGKDFPLKESTTLDGQTISIEDLKGKPTLVNLWFVNCPPCIEEMPALSNMYEKNKDKFNFVAITFEKKEKVEKFLKSHNFSLPQITNSSYNTKKMFKGYPKNIILDKEGKIHSINPNLMYKKVDGKTVPGDGDEILEKLEALL